MAKKFVGWHIRSAINAKFTSLLESENPLSIPVNLESLITMVLKTLLMWFCKTIGLSKFRVLTYHCGWNNTFQTKAQITVFGLFSIQTHNSKVVINYFVKAWREVAEDSRQLKDIKGMCRLYQHYVHKSAVFELDAACDQKIIIMCQLLWKMFWTIPEE